MSSLGSCNKTDERQLSWLASSDENYHILDSYTKVTSRLKEPVRQKGGWLTHGIQPSWQV